MTRQSSTNTQTSQGTFWNSAEFAARLRRERNRIGLNQKDFGALGGATLDSQSRYENAKNQPAAEYLAGLAVNGVDVYYILTGSRTESQALDSRTTEMLDHYFQLPPCDQDLAKAIIVTIKREVATRETERTLHNPAAEYRHG